MNGIPIFQIVIVKTPAGKLEALSGTPSGAITSKDLERAAANAIAVIFHGLVAKFQADGMGPEELADRVESIFEAGMATPPTGSCFTITRKPLEGAG